MLLHQDRARKTLLDEILQVAETSLSFRTWDARKQLRVWWRRCRGNLGIYGNFRLGGAGEGRLNLGGASRCGSRLGGAGGGGSRLGGAGGDGVGGAGWDRAGPGSPYCSRFWFHTIVHLGLEGIPITESVGIKQTCTQYFVKTISIEQHFPLANSYTLYQGE